MGLNFAFDLIASRKSAEQLVRAVAEHIEQRVDVLKRLQGAAERVFHDLISSKYLSSGGSKVCLRFLFPRDEALDEYDKAYQTCDAAGLYHVGCVWSHLVIGNRFVIFRARAATSDISRLFSSSQSIHNTFRAIAKNGGARIVTLDDDLDETNLRVIWPQEKHLPISTAIVDSFYDFSKSSDVDKAFDVDGYCDRVLDHL